MHSCKINLSLVYLLACRPIAQFIVCRYQEKIKERRQERARDEFEVNLNLLVPHVYSRVIWLILQKDKRRELQRRDHGKNVTKFKQERVSAVYNTT